MKKKIAFVCVILLGRSLFGVSEADILKKAKKAGQLTGAVVGAGLGAAGGIYATKWFVDKSELPVVDVVKKGVFGVAGAGSGVLPGAYLGGKLVEKASLLYLQKKYSISKRLASAYLVTGISPTDLAIRSIFQYAEEKDKAKVIAFLEDYFTKRFGTNWLDTVMKTIDAFLTLGRLDYDVRFAKGRVHADVKERIAVLNRQKKLVDKTMPSFQENVNKLLEGYFLYAIASLYLEASLLGFAGQGDPLPRIQKLIQVLFVSDMY